MMFQPARLMIVTILGSILLGRVALATDIIGPVNVLADTHPYVLFDQTSNAIPYQWGIGAHHFRFFVDDLSAGKTPFKIDTGSDNDLLCLAGSDVGIGTLTPARKLHLKGGYMRFENSLGGQPQTWEFLPDSYSFDIRDATNLTIPFRVETGAPSNSLFVQSDGCLGLGTSAPGAALHLKTPGQTSTAEIMARFETADDPIGALFIANNSAGDGVFVPKITGRSASQNAALINEAIITNDVGASAAIVYNAAKGAGGALATRPLVVYRNNSVAKVTIAANGNITATSFNPSSSRAIKHDIVDLDSKKASDALRQMTPVEFVYNDDETSDPRIGFIAEDVPDLIAEPDRKSVPVMDVVALVTRVVKDQDRLNEQQQRTIDQQQKTIGQQQSQIAELLKRLEALESQASTSE